MICWLHPPGDQKTINQIVEVSKGFSAIPGVEGVTVGGVVESERAVVDSSFDVALIITFKDTQAMAAYVDHPLHQKAVKEVFEPLVRRIVVYDLLESP